jgi:hypothetical protein
MIARRMHPGETGMTRLHRSIVAFVWALAAGVTPSMAQGIDPAVVGSWIAHLGPLDFVTLNVNSDGTFVAKRAKLVFPSVECNSTGTLEQPPHFSGFIASGSARCDVAADIFGGTRRLNGHITGRVAAAPGGRLSVRIAAPTSPHLQEALGLLQVTMSRRVGLGAGPGVSLIADALTGHWAGQRSGVAVALNLDNVGTFNGQVTGGPLDGCLINGSVAPDEAIVNTSTSFVDIGGATLSQCTDASRNGNYFVLLGARPQSLSLSLYDSEESLEDDAAVFSFKGMILAP